MTEQRLAKANRLRPAVPPPNVPPPGSQDAEVEVDSWPYSFWPPLPWAEEPKLRIPQADATAAEESRWLNSNPSHDREEERWLGIDVLGRGAYGVTGHWARVDEANNVVDVSVKASWNSELKKGNVLIFLVNCNQRYATACVCGRLARP